MNCNDDKSLSERVKLTWRIPVLAISVTLGLYACSGLTDDTGVQGSFGEQTCTGNTCSLCSGSGDDGPCQLTEGDAPEIDDSDAVIEAFSCGSGCEGVLFVANPETGEEYWYMTPGVASGEVACNGDDDFGDGGGSDAVVSAMDRLEPLSRWRQASRWTQGPAAEVLMSAQVLTGAPSRVVRSATCGIEKLPKCLQGIARFLGRLGGKADEAADVAQAGARGGRLIATNANDVGRLIGLLNRVRATVQAMTERLNRLKKLVDWPIEGNVFIREVPGSGGKKFCAQIPKGTTYADWKRMKELQQLAEDLATKLDDVTRKLDDAADLPKSEVKKLKAEADALAKQIDDAVNEATDIDRRLGQALADKGPNDCDIKEYIGTEDDLAPFGLPGSGNRGGVDLLNIPRG